MEEQLKKLLEELKTEVSSLKLRVRRIEEYILDTPDPSEYVRERDGQRLNEEDELIGEAEDIVREYEFASASLLQRRLEVGYSRATRLLDQLETRKVVGPAEGSKPRKVLVKKS